MFTKYIKSVLLGVAVGLSHIDDAWCLKVNTGSGICSRVNFTRTSKIIVIIIKIAAMNCKSAVAPVAVVIMHVHKY